MGVNIVNNMFGPHVPAGGACTGYRFTLHQGDADTVVVYKESPDCTASERDEIVSAANVSQTFYDESPDCEKAQRDEIIAAAKTSQAAFNAKLAALWPEWAATVSGARKMDLRTAALAY